MLTSFLVNGSPSSSKKSISCRNNDLDYRTFLPLWCEGSLEIPFLPGPIPKN